MAQEPVISVIIPTYNRAPILERTLRAVLDEQRGELPYIEVIVANDGSTDSTSELLKNLERDNSTRLSSIEDENRGQATARNRAMATAKGSLFVLLGDDVIPTPDFLSRHWLAYCAAGRTTGYAAIGRTTWHPEIPSTAFLQWVNEQGTQFGFALIEDPQNVPFNFFYASNLAISRDLYDSGGGFDEGLSAYGWEDVELGYRYVQQMGMRLVYVPEAIGMHHHEAGIESFCRRSYDIGYSATKLHLLHPELENFLGIRSVPSFAVALRPLLHLVARGLEFGDTRLALDVNRLARVLLRGYYLLGMQQAQRELRSPTA